jgi:hypothetical protein
MAFAAASGPDVQIPDQILRRRVPAWLLSLILHLAAMLLASFFVRGTRLPGESQETERPAAIVLARLTQSEKADYFSSDEARQTAATETAEPASPEGGVSAVAGAPPLSSAVKLPELTGPVPLSAEGLVVRPQPSAGGRRPVSLLTAADKAAILAADAARPRAQGPTGPTTRLGLFGSAEAEGRSFVFLIDRSQSMGGGGLGAIEAAAKELAGCVGRLEESHKFQVIAYNQKPLYLTGRELLPATEGNKKQLIEFVKDLPAFGATEHEIGIFAALKLKPDVIFLLTDGGDPHLSAGQLRSIQGAAQGTAIHCLHFGSGPRGDERSFLQTLAEKNGGSYVYIDMSERR